jgi:hypothetical protein
MESAMPRGIPKHKENISKMEGMRRALTELGNEASNKEIQAFLDSRFGIDMDLSMISNYKSSLKAAASKSTVAAKPAMSAPRTNATTGISLDEIRAVKEVVDMIGAEKVKQLAEVLGK